MAAIDKNPNASSDLKKALEDLSVEKYSARFNILQARYSSKGGDPIRVDVLVPRKLPANKFSAPIMVRIHGGFLITGSSLYPPWFNTWILDYAIENNAIVISPDYRLLPEVTGSDIMEDMSTFWSWLQSGTVDTLLQEHNHDGLKADLSRMLLVGESAGGYLATQLALTYYRDIKSLIALYPMIDLQSPFYNTVFSKPIIKVSNRDNSLVDHHIRSKPTPVSHCESFERLMLAFSVVQNGRLLEFLGKRSIDTSISSLFPLERLEDAEDADGQGHGSNLPRMFIFHGEQDSAVPVEGSIKFVKTLRVNRPKVRLDFYTQDGDHGFDTFATLDTPWLAKGLAPITETWLGSPTNDGNVINGDTRR